MKTKRTHFTLVEVLVTIAIIVILAGILIGGIGFATRRADEAKTIAQLETLAAALEAHRADRGYYPKQDPEGAVSITIDADGMKFNGKKFFNRQTKQPYLKAAKSGSTVEFNDAWGNALYYQCPGTHNPAAYDLWSMGPDGKDATDDDKVDNITNWNDNNK